MNGVLDKYFTTKRNEMLEYISIMSNIFSYEIEINIKNQNQIIKKILNIYFSKYYKINNINYEELNKYYQCDNEIDTNYKTIILSVIKYYEKEKIDIKSNDKEILYLSYIIYFGYLIDRLKSTIMLIPNKIDFIKSIANKVSSNFICKDDYKFQKNFYKLIEISKEHVKKERKLIKSLDNITYNKEFHNNYSNIKAQFGIYKILNTYKISELELYKEKDAKRMLVKTNTNNTFKLMSYQLAQVVLLKCLLKGQRLFIALEIDRDFYKKKMNTSKLLKLTSSSYAVSYTLLYITADEYTECENIDELKTHGLKMIIDVKNYEEYKNIKFDEKMILLVDKDFIFKHKQELEENQINYIEKEEEKIYKEKELFRSKTDIVEVEYE